MENIKIALCFLGAVVFFIFGLIFANVYIVDQGEKAVVTNFGEISKTWGAGFHVKIPFVQSVKKIFCTSSKNCFW